MRLLMSASAHLKAKDSQIRLGMGVMVIWRRSLRESGLLVFGIGVTYEAF